MRGSITPRGTTLMLAVGWTTCTRVCVSGGVRREGEVLGIASHADALMAPALLVVAQRQCGRGVRNNSFRMWYIVSDHIELKS